MDTPSNVFDAFTVGDAPRHVTSQLLEWLQYSIANSTSDYGNSAAPLQADAFSWLSAATEFELRLCGELRWPAATHGVDAPTPLLQSIVYLELAKAHYALGDNDASLSLARGCDAALWDALDNRKAHQIRDHSAAGAAGRDRRFEPFKAALAELLISHRPPGGWRSKAHAGRELSAELLKLNDARVLSAANIQKRIERWITSETSVAAAYDASGKTAGQ